MLVIGLINMEKTIKITNCLQCPNHQVINDSDPYDSFCSDDLAVVCILSKNLERDPQSRYVADKQEFRCITRSCRPHHLKKESDIPKWCPL